MKFLFISIQAYLLFLNTVFAESGQIHQKQMNAVFYSLNRTHLTNLSTAFTSYQKNPSTFMAKFKDKKIKDYKNIVELTNQHAKELKDVKVVMKDDNLQISYQNQVLTISEIGFNGAMIINDKEINWNPEKDTFNDLQNQLSLILKKKNSLSLMNWLIPNAQANPGVMVVIGITLIVLAVLADRRMSTDKELATMLGELKKSVGTCESDLKTLQSKEQTVIVDNETLKFINFVNLYKEYELLSCENLKSKRLKNYVGMPYDKFILEKIEEACNVLKDLENCLSKYTKDLDTMGITDQQRTKEQKIKEESGYYGIYNRLTNGTVVSKNLFIK